MSVKKFCYCENNCKYETLDKEDILAAIAQAVKTGTVGECDTGFITTIKTINGQPLKFFVGEQSEYAALSDEQKANLFAIITNDTTKEGLYAQINELIAAAEEQQLFKESILNGDLAVPQAETAETAEKAESDANGNIISTSYKSLKPSIIVDPYDATKETINLNSFTLNNGTHYITTEQIEGGKILNLPAETEELYADDNLTAVLTVSVANNNTIQTLEFIHQFTQPTASNVFRRRYSIKQRSWSEWVQLATVEELTSGDLVVNKAETANKASVLNGCTEATLDETNGGFIINEAGLYLLIGVNEDSSILGWDDYYTELIAIPFIDKMAYGASYDGETYRAFYASYDPINDYTNISKYRLMLNAGDEIKPYKAFKIMSL